MSKSRLITATALGAVALLLSGCGSASPGVAVQIGDQEISNRRVDEASEHMCTALADQFEEQGTVVPMGFVRQGVVQLLTLRSQADQIADAYDVKPGSGYSNDVSQRKVTVSSMPQDVRDDYVELTSANALATDILKQVGRIELERKGVEDPTVDEVSQTGLDVFNSWPDSNGIEIDPRYGLESVDGVLSPVDTNLSVAVSDSAKSGLALEPDPAFANTLPLTHRCG